MKMSYILRDELAANISKNFKVNQFQMEVSKFIDSKSDVLFLPGPSKRLYFLDNERSKFYPLIGITEGEIIRAKRKLTLTDNWYKLDSEFNILMALAIRDLELKKRPKEVQSALIMMALSMYAPMHSKYFKYEPNENIMNYTVNNLSNKFKLKQLGNLFKTIVYTVTSTHETYKADIIDGSDENIRKYIIAVHTRLNGFLCKIANEFYENHKKGNYINTEEDNNDEENFHIADNNSLLIRRVSDNAVYSLVSKGLDIRLNNLAASIADISSSALRNAINNIISEKDQEVKELLLLILQLYLEDGENPPESIRSKKFIAFSLEVYTKSNTSDQSIIRIKELLDKWLTECSVNYIKTERVATKNSFRKALYLYFILVIQQSYSS